MPELRAKCEVLKAGLDADFPSRFSNGFPCEDELEAARRSLSEAKKLQTSINTFSQASTSGEGGATRTFLAAFTCLLGAMLLVVAFLPSMQAFLLPLLIGGGALLAVGGAFTVVFLMRRSGGKKRIREMDAKLSEWKDKRDRALQAVKSLLARFDMPTGEPEQALAELAVLADQYRKQSGQIAKRREELERLYATEEEILSRLHRFLTRYFPDLEKKRDYRFEWNELQNDVQSLRHLRAEEQGKAKRRAEVEQTLRVLREQLAPLLSRYDDLSQLPADECLDRLSDRLAERRRLERELEVKSADLCRFIADNRLDEAERVSSTDSFEELNREERELRERAAELENVCANLQSHIEHFALDVDRIPEIEAELARLRVARDEAKANAATIAHTAKLLEESKTALSTRYLAGMQESFDGFLQELTANTAPEALMDTSFEIRMREAGQTRSMESFSRGWRDAVELCVRLSLTDALYAEGERPFLLLDDPLVNLDDERLTAARAMLEKLAEKYQILYFVCHKDRI